jgi:putative addiction module component (TIGR02574 family)
MTKAEAILQEALALDESERAELAGLLLESIEPPAEAEVEAAWGDEVRRRVAKIDSGQAKLVPWEEVREELVRRLNDRL